MQAVSPIDWQRWTDTQVSEARFHQRREPLLRHASYAGHARDKLAAIFLTTTELENFEPYFRMQSTHRRVSNALDWLSLQYSAGAPVGIFAGVWPRILLWSEEYLRSHTTYRELREARPNTEQTYRAPIERAVLTHGEYWSFALRLVCFGLLSGHCAEMPRVMAVLDACNVERGARDNLLKNGQPRKGFYKNRKAGKQDIRDGLIEHLVASFVPGRDTPPGDSARALPYGNLSAIFTARHEQRPALMKRYLEEWYSASRKEPYFNQHGKADAGFYGYWSWEAAAVTWLLDIDDTSYRNQPFYPRDLVDFARHPATGFPPRRASSGNSAPVNMDGQEASANQLHPFLLMAKQRVLFLFAWVRRWIWIAILWLGMRILKFVHWAVTNSLSFAILTLMRLAAAPGTWKLLRLLIPGNRKVARQQVHAWMKASKDEDGPELLDLIHQQAGFEIDRGDVAALVRAIDTRAARWNLCIDWIGTRNDEELSGLDVPELMAVAHDQLRVNGFTLWSRGTGQDTHAGWIARTRDDRKIQAVATRLNIELRPGNDPF